MNFAVIFAGGTGRRMGNSSVPKQFLNAYSKPILVHTIEQFQESCLIDAIIISCLEAFIPLTEKLVNKYNLTKVVSIVPGGKNGQESIYNGLYELVRKFKQNDTDIVLIHDGVRPLITDILIEKNIECTLKNGNAITVAKATETIMVLDETNTVNSILKRDNCMLARAPQTFYLKDIWTNHIKAIQEGQKNFIDSATLMQHYGTKLYTVEGPAENIKITTPMDYYLYKALLDAQENNQLSLL